METYFGRWNIYLGRTLWYAPSFSKNYMKRILASILVAAALMAISTGRVYAQVADSSAQLKSSQPSDEGFDFRVENLRNFLSRFNSPLEAYASYFVRYADVYGLDYRLVPSISGVESTFGKQIPYDSFNAYGWANGGYSFKSWADSISVVSSTLKANYIDKGALTVSRIARIYAPPSTTWGTKVQYFEKKIDTLPLTFDLNS